MKRCVEVFGGGEEGDVASSPPDATKMERKKAWRPLAGRLVYF